MKTAKTVNNMVMVDAGQYLKMVEMTTETVLRLTAENDELKKALVARDNSIEFLSDSILEIGKATDTEPTEGFNEEHVDSVVENTVSLLFANEYNLAAQDKLIEMQKGIITAQETVLKSQEKIFENNKEIADCDKIIIDNLNIVAQVMAKRLVEKYGDDIGNEYFKMQKQTSAKNVLSEF